MSSHPLQELSGIGTKLAAKLARIGINAPRDLLFHLPLRYQDRTHITPIGELQIGQDAVVVGRVELTDVRYARRRMLVVRIRDSSAAMLVRFFYFGAAQMRSFTRNSWVRCYGEVRQSGQIYEMIHPEYRLFSEQPGSAGENSLTPIYPSTEGISAAVMRKLVSQAINHKLETLEEFLPIAVRSQFKLMPLKSALQTVHRPPPEDAELLSAAQLRLSLEELLAHHLALSRQRIRHKKYKAPNFNLTEVDNLTPAAKLNSWPKLKSQLGFELTVAQNRVIGEILHDFKLGAPAMRLLQGDVGSGKTVVAAAAALYAIDAGYQVALMAPTELLADQHRNTFQQWFAIFEIEIGYLSGKISPAERSDTLARIKSGAAKMIIGTHALFQQQVEFHQLGLMIVDELHRFGVDQRLALRNKSAMHNYVPHQLIMSATPIPRSVAMIFYADLDVSNIDELPPGRKPVHTIVIPNSRRPAIAARIRAVCQGGRQAYWVCPLIDESDKLQAEAATKTHSELKHALPELAVELIHGRMKSADKESVMQRFHRGEINLLVATTVIEVGVDVAAASLMIIENAERLGLAQLHQLRGRVGRGDQQATCVLMYQAPLGEIARERLRLLRTTTDGFIIARKDLEQRGPGELLGTRQTGLPQMKVADLARDRALLPTIARLGKILQTHHPEVIDKIITRWIHTSAAYVEV